MVDNISNDPKDFPRVKTAADAASICTTVIDDDSSASEDRAKLLAMLAGEPPYNDQELINLGRGYQSNVSFHEAKAELEAAMAPYHDLVNGVDRVATCKVEYGDSVQRIEWTNIVSEEFSTLLRENWDRFYFNYEMLCRNFVGFGIGFAAFEDEIDWRWCPYSLEDFKLRRDTPAHEDACEIICIPKSYYPYELWGLIKNRKAAEEMGWNYDATMEAILSAQTSNPNATSVNDWEAFERSIAENGFTNSVSDTAPKVYTNQLLVREFDGTFSHYILSSNNPTEFMFKKNGRFEDAGNFFTMFTYGIGQGTIHTIRGLLQNIYPQIQLSNQIQNGLIDSTKFSMSIVARAVTPEAVENAAVVDMGIFKVVPRSIEVIPNAIPNVGRDALPVMNYLRQQRQNNTGGYSQRAITPDGQERTKFEVQAELAQQNVLSQSAMDLFYNPWKRLLREQFYRLKKRDWRQGDPGGKEALEFIKRCLDRKVPLKAIESVKIVEPVRAIGYGSPAKRLLEYERLMNIMPYMPPEGQNAVLRNMITAIMGNAAQADAFIPRINTASIPTEDSKIAEMENGFMRQGMGQSLYGNDLIHANIHGVEVNSGLQALSQGQADVNAVMTMLGTALPHWQAHIENMRDDPARAGLYGKFKQNLELATKAYNQLNQRMQAEQQAQLNALQEQAGAMQAQGQPVDPLTQAKIAEIQSKIAQRQQKMQIDAAKFQLTAKDKGQKMAIRDMETAQAINESSQENMLLPIPPQPAELTRTTTLSQPTV